MFSKLEQLPEGEAGLLRLTRRPYFPVVVLGTPVGWWSGGTERSSRGRALRTAAAIRGVGDEGGRSRARSVLGLGEFFEQKICRASTKEEKGWPWYN